MKNNEQLAKRFREVILNGTWIANTNYKIKLYEFARISRKFAQFVAKFILVKRCFGIAKLNSVKTKPHKFDSQTKIEFIRLLDKNCIYTSFILKNAFRPSLKD
jgi:hypothetical protein